MPPCLQNLPYDVVWSLSTYLDIEDVVHLHNACRQLRFILDEETLTRKVVENCASHTLEAKQASDTSTRISYGDAIRRIYKRRRALTAGHPVTATALGFATSAVYDDGIVCFVQQRHIEVIDLHISGNRSQLTISSILRKVTANHASCDCNAIRLLNYSQGILALLFEDEKSDTFYLLAVDISEPTSPKHVMFPETLRNVNKLFVRHTKRFLYYGTHSASGGSSGYREWILQGISLGEEKFMLTDGAGSTKPSRKSEKIQLRDFAGSDMGSTVCFKLHNDYLYALTNCDAFDVIEIDWTSFYQVVRFPIHDARKETCERNHRIYRRQHAEGPIMDGWTSIDLQVDERTNELLIIEGRSEWPTGGGTLSRGFYAQKVDLDFDGPNLVEECQQQIGPAQDPLSRIPDDETKYSPWQDREAWQCHPEAGNEREHFLSNAGVVPKCTLARTKYQKYIFAAGTSLDLVERDCSCRGAPDYCLQLRSATRRLAPLMACKGAAEESVTKGKELGLSMPASSSLPYGRLPTIPHGYEYAPISLWPNDNVKIHQVMNLPADPKRRAAVQVTAFADERCLVYFVRSGGVGKVVCLSFDGDAAVSKLEEGPVAAPMQIRGRSPKLQSDPEHLRGISPDRQAYEQARFEPHEMAERCFETMTDLDDIPDAGLLDRNVLENWFDSFGIGSSRV